MDEDALLQQALAMSMQVRLPMQSILTPLCKHALQCAFLLSACPG